jgi:hypothetical protein
MAELVKKILTDKKARLSKKIQVRNNEFQPWTVA